MILKKPQKIFEFWGEFSTKSPPTHGSGAKLKDRGKLNFFLSFLFLFLLVLFLDLEFQKNYCLLENVYLDNSEEILIWLKEKLSTVSLFSQLSGCLG